MVKFSSDIKLKLSLLHHGVMSYFHKSNTCHKLIFNRINSNK